MNSLGVLIESLNLYGITLEQAFTWSLVAIDVLSVGVLLCLIYIGGDIIMNLTNCIFKLFKNKLKKNSSDYDIDSSNQEENNNE